MFYDVLAKKNVVFPNVKAEYHYRVRNAPKIDPKNFGTTLPICYSSIGPAKTLELRPLGRLPPHIIKALNDHYVQLTRGSMVPAADLYNNGDHPAEQRIPTMLNENEYLRLIQELEEEEKSKQFSATSSSAPHVNPYSAQHLVNGEIIGIFVIYGTGLVTRAVCSQTREMFTAHVLPEWKASKVIDVIRRLQIPTDISSMTADEIRLSELCISKRMEIIKSNDRYILMNPCESATIHSYATERLDEITENDVMSIYQKVVEIVRFCHSRKVILQNFKPRSFYLKKDAHNKWVVRPCFLQDMSCEEDQSEAQFTRRSVCVPFMAPEMLTAESRTHHSYSTELWGLGVLLYILLTGKYPFHENSMPLLFRTIKFKQHRWPFNFISSKSRNIVNMLLKKAPATRMNLEDLWNQVNGDFPEIRCRSNIILKKQDMIVKMDLFEMYYNTYKDRLLPKNVLPMYEEMKACRNDSTILTEMAKRDFRSIQEQMKRRIETKPTEYQTLVMQVRLQQINQLFFEKEVSQAQKQHRAPRLVQLKCSDISKELLLPGDIYPISEHYHPSQQPVDKVVYKLLSDANSLAFPTVMKGTVPKSYPPPVFKGLDISPS